MIELTCALPTPHDRHHRWQEGDLLTHVDGRPVEDVLDLYYYQPDGATMTVVNPPSGRR